MEKALVFKIAGISAWLAIPSLLLAGVFLALFFGGRGDKYGPLNDVLSAVTLLLLILPAVGVYLMAREAAVPWFKVVTVLAVAGMAVGAGGQLLLVMGVISLGASFVTGGIGILPVLGWAVCLAVLSLRLGVLSAALGWLTVAVLVLVLCLVVASSLHMKAPTWILTVGLIAALVAWLGDLGWQLVRAA